MRKDGEEESRKDGLAMISRFLALNSLHFLF